MSGDSVAGAATHAKPRSDLGGSRQTASPLPPEAEPQKGAPISFCEPQVEQAIRATGLHAAI